jgi:hypothetical protein
MGIDGIGKSGPPPSLDGPAGKQAGATSAPETEFRVERTQATPSNDLERLERNEISREEYLNNRVEQATAHLQGHLSPERLNEVKQQMLAQLEVDPVLRRLVQRVTGVAESQASGSNES